MSKAGLFFALLTALLISCRGKTDQKSGSYFDSLVDAQVKFLTSSKAGVMKKARIDGKDGQSMFTPDEGVWNSELDVFRQLSAFEKPIYRVDYIQRDRLHDTKSNLFIRSFTATAKIPVVELKFYYYKEFKNIKRIEATYVDESALYSFRRVLFMDFDEVNGRPGLRSYGMDGTQKIVLHDSVRFSIISTIRF